MIGTLINSGTVIVGSIIGLLIRNRLPKRFVDTVFLALGLITIGLGVSMSVTPSDTLVVIFSLVIGAVIGESLRFEERADRLADRVKSRFSIGHHQFSEGLVTAFLLFCVGSMTVLGAFEEGMGNPPNLLLTKSLMDGMASIALASALGAGVLFSVIPLIILQGGLTLFASYLQDYVTEAMMTNISAAGGLILIGLGIKILKIKDLKILNLLPALVIVVVLTMAVSRFQ